VCCNHLTLHSSLTFLKSDLHFHWIILSWYIAYHLSVLNKFIITFEKCVCVVCVCMRMVNRNWAPFFCVSGNLLFVSSTFSDITNILTYEDWIPCVHLFSAHFAASVKTVYVLTHTVCCVSLTDLMFLQLVSLSFELHVWWRKLHLFSSLLIIHWISPNLLLKSNFTYIP
jgi:hypothetical protein